MHIVICYATYLTISLAATIWVAQTLRRNGRAFLIAAFHGNSELADSVNHLLVVGFYLINIGFVSLALKSGAEVGTWRAGIEMLSDKLGWVLLTLGGMHFFNLFVFSRVRSRAQGQGHGNFRPQVAPDAVLKLAVPPPPPIAAR